MRFRTLLIGLSAAGLCLATAQASGRQPADDEQEPGEAVLARLRAGLATPEAEAAAAAGRGDFGMFMIRRIRGPTTLPGIRCATPYALPPAVVASETRGDAMVISETPGETFDELGARYNRALVSAPAFRYADLCAPSEPPLIGASYLAPLREPFGPPFDLASAARYGTASQVRRFLRTTAADQEDVFGMTPLGWAVARNRSDVIGLLLAAGADPLAREARYGVQMSPLFVATSAGRPRLVERLLRARKDAAPWRWPPYFVEAAIRGGDVTLVHRVLAEPHDSPNGLRLGDEVSLDVAQALVRSRDPRMLEAVLAKGVDAGRPEFVRLALAHGASPNFAPSYETVLSLAAKGLHRETDIEIVRLLLDAGADVNLRDPNLVWGETPIWGVAASFMAYRKADWATQEQILIILLDAGADLKQPSRKGAPLIWRLLFGAHIRKDEIDSAPPPRILVLLAGRGMDVNARWQGQTPLDWVDEVLGPRSEMATALRAAGAVRS